MDLKTASIDGRIVDVISEKKYLSDWRSYNEVPQMCSSTAMEVQDQNGIAYILPFRGKSDDRPGIYLDGSVYFTKFPDTEQDKSYRADQVAVVDFGDIKNVEDFLNKNSQIRDMETVVLTDIESVFTPPISPSDSPEMRAFKEAIASKRMDINKYAPRFGDNYLNDKRILKTNAITMNKLRDMCEKLDIEAELILRDAGSDVANPMGKEIRVILTDKGGDEQ